MRVVSRLPRVEVARGASFLFSAVLVLFWMALTVGGSALGAQRWFVRSVLILVDVYSTVMVGIFWTYTNDVVSPEEADSSYGPIGIGGIAGGALVDSLVSAIGPVHILLLCAGLGVACGALVMRTERLLQPRPRDIDPTQSARGIAAALEGAHEVARSRHLLLIVGLLVGVVLVWGLCAVALGRVYARQRACVRRAHQPFEGSTS